MAEQRMLHDVMRVNDIYLFAEPIIQMLREEYGSYDADVLDEVLVDDTFVQRLTARGYDVLPSAQASVTPAEQPVENAAEDTAKPKTPRRTAAASSTTTSARQRPRRDTSATEEAEPKAESETPTRPRRASTTRADSEETGTTTRRSTRTTRARTAGNGEGSTEA